jgi:hypothetical protein
MMASIIVIIITGNRVLACETTRENGENEMVVHVRSFKLTGLHNAESAPSVKRHLGPTLWERGLKFTRSPLHKSCTEDTHGPVITALSLPVLVQGHTEMLVRRLLYHGHIEGLRRLLDSDVFGSTEIRTGQDRTGQGSLVLQPHLPGPVQLNKHITSECGVECTRRFPQRSACRLYRLRIASVPQVLLSCF